jgi:hypothetical protein
MLFAINLSYRCNMNGLIDPPTKPHALMGMRGGGIAASPGCTFGRPPDDCT